MLDNTNKNKATPVAEAQRAEHTGLPQGNGAPQGIAFDECFNYMFFRAQQIILQIFRENMQAVGITPSQYGILNYLLQKKSATAVQLAQQFGMESSTITGLLDRLERKGLIERRADAIDRRVHQIVLTKAGTALREPLFAAGYTSNAAVVEKIGAENVEQLRDLLRSLYK